MTSSSSETGAAQPQSYPGLNGWVEAALFVLALAVLNISYGFGQILGVHPVALLFWAMPAAATALLVSSGLGPHWREILRHPLSLVVGAGIIAMEAVYYILLGYITPTDGSILVRLSVPIAIALGYFVAGRRPRRLAIAGSLVTIASILWYSPHMGTTDRGTALALGALCGFIMSGRSFAAEHHPWNRAATTIRGKMRVTGLVLALACTVGVSLLFATMAMSSAGLATAPPWVPQIHQLVYGPAVVIGLFVGVLVLTAMQYFGFSVVLKLGAERFIASGAFIPVTTLAVQMLAAAAGFLRPVSIGWQVWPAMLGLVAGVALVIAGQPRLRPVEPSTC